MNDELLIKFILKETSAEEDLLVAEWLASDPANKNYLSQFEAIWDAGKNLEPKSTVDENAAWLRFKEKAASVSGQQEVVVKPFTKKYNWLKIAASLFLVAGAWFSYSYFFRISYTTLATTQQVKVDTLPDGSEVTLNKNSALCYAKEFRGNKRSIHFQKGEAFFKVTPDKAKPFVIEAGNVLVTVVGTSFNVSHTGNETEVIVETGIVRVTRNGESVLLHPGEKVRIDKENRMLGKEQNTDKLYNYYQSKEFVADNTPLWRLTEVLSEAYHVNIIIQKPGLKNLTLTTTFKNQPLDSILAIISQTFDIKAEKTGNRIILK